MFRRDRVASCVAALSAACTLLANADTANAQIGYESRTRFALGHGANPTPIAGPITVSSSGRIDLTLQLGVFNAQGFDNYGVGLWSGSITASEPLLSRPPTPRVAPFSGAFGYDGNINAAGTQIGLPGERLIEPTRGDVFLPYSLGEPVPAMPAPAGDDEFVNIYRFSITITNLLTPRAIAIRADGRNWPLEGFFTVQHLPPDPETGDPGFIWYSPNPAGNGPTPARPAQLSILTIHVVPAPSTVAIITGATVFIARRRRPSAR